VYITGIRFRAQGADEVTGLKLTTGIGKMRPVVAVRAPAQHLETIAHAINFAFSGKRSGKVLEVWLDAADDAGDIWTIERGTKGSIFRRNNKLLSIEDAQRSVLASLLDLDVSLNQSEGLVAPVEMRRIITRGAEVAATHWDPNLPKERSDVAGLIAARKCAERCAEKLGVPELADVKKLSRVAGPSARILGALEELAQQQSAMTSDQRVSERDQGLDVIQSELDLLNQIDQLLRRINEGGDSLSKLSTMLEAQNERIKAIINRWNETSLDAVQKLQNPFQILEQLIRVRSWSKFSENLNRLAGLIDEQVSPLQAAGLRVWSEYLGGARNNGQEIESCLASMLLGIKQMSHEIERYVSQGTIAGHTLAASSKAKNSSWFDRLKSGATKVVDDMTKENSVGVLYQRDWVMRLSREVESVKVATEYALQSSQGLSDKMHDSRAKIQSESQALASLAQKAMTEYQRLNSDWTRSAEELGIDVTISLENLAVLIRDALEYAIAKDLRHDLAVRVDDRRNIQSTLESLIRRWWELIGSQKSTDLSNVSFLVVEAKAALRYREGRRQRVKKGLEDIAGAMAQIEANAYIQRRREVLKREWIRLFELVELPPPALELPHVQVVAEAASQCAALLDVVRLEENDRFAAASLWPSRLDSAVLAYYWPDSVLTDTQRVNFIRALGAFAGDGSVPVLLLVGDVELAQMLAKAGTGSGLEVQLEGVSVIDGPRREGAVVKSEMKSRRIAGTKDSGPAAVTAKAPRRQSELEQSSILSARAEAALKILNPKSGQ
jgi:hypothetical protein